MKRLKELRTQRNLTQKDVADVLQISRPAYTNYETGKRNLDNEALLKLSEFYNVSTDYLLGNDEPIQKEKSPSELDELLNDPLNKELLLKLAKLSPETKQSLAVLIQGLQDK